MIYWPLLIAAAAESVRFLNFSSSECFQFSLQLTIANDTFSRHHKSISNFKTDLEYVIMYIKKNQWKKRVSNFDYRVCIHISSDMPDTRQFAIKNNDKIFSIIFFFYFHINSMPLWNARASQWHVYGQSRFNRDYTWEWASFSSFA